MSKNKIEEGSTAHQRDPAPAGGAPGGETMPMGMTGTGGPGDPDQKSTHVPPNTVESNFPDGSPRYADKPKGKAKPATRKNAARGKYEVVNRISTATAFNEHGVAIKRATFEPGDVIDLDVDEAESLGDNVKPVK